MSWDGIAFSADLGSSSNYSNECTTLHIREACRALKAVVEKVSLKLANRQGSVGPKTLRKRF